MYQQSDNEKRLMPWVKLTCKEALSDASVNDLRAAFVDELMEFGALQPVDVLITESFPFPNDNDCELVSTPLKTESVVL